MSDVIYVFQGETGVPGLPHRVTMAEAEALGMAEELKAAIESGLYEPEDPAPGPSRRRSRKPLTEDE